MNNGGRPDADADVDTDADTGMDTDGDIEEIDWEMAPDPDADFPADPKRVTFPCGIAGDIYGESSKSRQVSVIPYRVSDLYDPDGDTSPKETYLNVRHIMDIKVQGGIDC